MKLLDGALGLHGQALAVRTKRLELLAQNLANADTPNFKARDIDFRQVLAETNNQPAAMTATRDTHYELGEIANSDGVLFRVPFNTAVDGNTVESSIEQAQYGKAAAQYQTTLNFLESRIAGVRKALRGE
jgi:flagellar basal-body rod protein FlgB